MPSNSLLAGIPLLFSFAIASLVLKPWRGIPAYAVSGECGAVGPAASEPPKKSHVITLNQFTAPAAPAYSATSILPVAHASAGRPPVAGSQPQRRRKAP